VYADILEKYHLDKPIWLTETNCPIYNDRAAPIEPHHHITTSEQAGFLIQAVALARAAGYQRIGWYAMQDVDPRTGIADRWGLVRADGSPRPAYRAFRVASQYLAGTQVVARVASVANVTRVIVDDPEQHTRAQVVWRSAGGPRTVIIAPSASNAHLLDAQGFSTPATRVGAGWEVPLPPVRVAEAFDPPGFQSLGDPILLVETDVHTTSGTPALTVVQ
jgi:hypothetical protein